MENFKSEICKLIGNRKDFGSPRNSSVAQLFLSQFTAIRNKLYKYFYETILVKYKVYFSTI